MSERRAAETDADVGSEAGALRFAEVAEMTGRVVRQGGRSLLAVWLAATVAELAIWSYVSGGEGAGMLPAMWSQEALEGALRLLASGEVILVLVVVATLIAFFREGMWEPLRRSVLDGWEPGPGEVTGAASRRTLSAFGIEQVLALLATLAVIGCFLLDVIMPAYVVLPLMFTLSPATYFVVARRMGIGEALVHTIRLTRRHWGVVWGVQAALVVLAALVQGFLDGVAAAGVGPLAEVGARAAAFSVWLGYEYVSWVATAGLYLALDVARDR